MAEVFVFIADYRDVGDALVDYCAVKNLYRRGAIDTYDAALVQRDQDGTVHVNKREKPTRKAAWTGAVVGAVVGVLFPPAILPMMAAGGVTGRIDRPASGQACRAGTSKSSEKHWTQGWRHSSSWARPRWPTRSPRPLPGHRRRSRSR